LNPVEIFVRHLDSYKNPQERGRCRIKRTLETPLNRLRSENYFPEQKDAAGIHKHCICVLKRVVEVFPPAFGSSPVGGEHKQGGE